MDSPDFPADTKGVLESEVELLYCLGPEHCVSLAYIAAGHRIFKMLVARDSPFVLLIRGPDPSRATVDVIQLLSGLRVGHFPVGVWIHGMHNQPIEWVGSRILARWGAGTCLAFATVYDVSGTTVATYAGSWIGFSPNNKYIAEAGAQPGGPCANTSLAVYELKTGAKLHSKTYSSRIDEVIWHKERGEAIVLLQTPTVGLLRKEVIQLEN